jgi:hypothetical protein
MVVIFAFLCTAIDPTDINIYKEREALKKGYKII